MAMGVWSPLGPPRLPSRRGLIMGIWNSHTSVGNILGSLLAGVWVDQQWGLSFVVPGVITAIMGIITFFFLIECEWTPLPLSPQGQSKASQLGSGRRRLVPWGSRGWRPRRVTQRMTSLSLDFSRGTPALLGCGECL